ncbi:MAG TPA: adenylate/guanylate cyclase domain-containing protein, partial [Acidimicrobiia bacterium]|nr:adenylate/guanylate cyclase domain-containing protein [Acidimicrobiia bacterium]
MRGAAVVLTFLFTDLVDSTRAWREHPQEMNAALAAHDDIVRTEIDRRGGTIFATGGDGFAAVFVAPDAALAAAVQMQRAIPAVTDVAGLALAPRIGVHTGEAIARDGDYFGAHVNKAARIAALGHGGQIVLSGTTADLITRPPRATSFELRGEHRLKGFADPERIVELVLDERRTRFPPLRSLAPAVTNLPGVTTSFVGRDEELATLRTLLAQRPLVTLVAPGGSGKTRLAVEIARSLVDEYGDGVWFVDLADVSEPAAVAAAFLAVGDLSETVVPADVDSLTAALGSRRILIVADNCEQAVDAVADLAGAVLARCPEARILATSRRPLGVVGEQQVRVTTLDTEGCGAEVSPASRLFIDRARLVRPEYSPSHPEMATIDEICRRLDGLPLAIELAAARTGVFSVHDLAGRLDDARLLAGDRRVLRHQSLDAVVEWSHDLLGALDRRAFRRLAVFAGSWNLAAAEDVLPDDKIRRDEVAGALSRLVEHSLIAAEPASGVTRYRMLATIAAFASAKLDESGERETVRARLRDHFSAGLAARARDFEHFVWAAPADDVANVQAALECSIATQSPDQAAELLAYATPLLSVTSASSGWRSSFAANMTARLRASGTLTRRGREWIELSETVAAEIGGDFVVADELATRLRATTDDDVVLFISSFLYGHHRAAFDPAAAAAGFDRMT